jgi:hypothetical protein
MSRFPGNFPASRVRIRNIWMLALVFALLLQPSAHTPVAQTVVLSGPVHQSLDGQTERSPMQHDHPRTYSIPAFSAPSAPPSLWF